MHYISIVSTIITFIFAGAVFYRFKQRGGIHLLYWGIGLLLYGIGTMMEAIMLFTFAPLALKLWYLTGAMLTAAWLGQGTVNLLVRKRNITRLLNAILLGVSLLALVLVLFAPVDAVAAQSYNLDQPASGQYQAIMERSGLMILLTILLNIYGTTVSVAYATEDGTATAGSDYLSRSGVLSFAPGVVSRPVSVPVVGDWVREGAESFQLELSEPTHAVLARDGCRRRSGTTTRGRTTGTGTGGRTSCGRTR